VLTSEDAAVHPSAIMMEFDVVIPDLVSPECRATRHSCA
jgi:hypothetical protein